MFCSIIVPVYRAEQYLDQCIKSILNQTSSDWELVLVDDGSPDRSGQICDRYAAQDPRIRVLHQENGGHTAARNAGLAAAQGRYVYFVDSDDWIDQTLVGDCQAVVRDREADMILFGFRRIEGEHQSSRPQPRAQGYYTAEDLAQKILPTFLSQGHFSLSEHMVKRELMIAGQKQVDQRLLLGEDLLCCVSFVAMARSAYVLPGVYYNYVQHETSVSHTRENYSFEDWLILRHKMNETVGHILPDYPAQRGTCSIRFLQRAILGEVHRGGFRPKTFRLISQYLKREEIAQDIARSTPQGKLEYRVKRMLLKRRWSGLMYLMDRAVQLYRKK